MHTGAADTYHWVQWLEDWLRLIRFRRHHARIRVLNGAVPGTTSSYMSVCYNMHVPRDVDIVVLEYAVNDEASPSVSDYETKHCTAHAGTIVLCACTHDGLGRHTNNSYDR